MDLGGVIPAAATGAGVYVILYRVRWIPVRHVVVGG